MTEIDLKQTVPGENTFRSRKKVSDSFRGLKPEEEELTQRK